MILITGGAGYIGSHVALSLLEKGNSVIIFDNLSTGQLFAVQQLSKLGNLVFIKGDLQDEKAIRTVFQQYPVRVVMHLASFIEVKESMVNPEKYYKNNIQGGLNLFSAMLAFGVKRLVFSSTAAVYGNPIYIPIDEEHPKNPVNTYGYSKLVLEKILADYDLAYGLKTISLRYFNVIGADHLGRIGENHQPETHLVPNLLKASQKGDVFKLFGDDYLTSDGTCVRDYVDVEDLADAHYLSLNYLIQHSNSLALNLGLKTGYSNREIIKFCELITGKNINVRSVSARLGDPAILVANNAKAYEMLNWVPRRSLKDSIERAWKWMNKKNN